MVVDVGPSMDDVIVIGGGPAGLSTALFTAKNGLETVLFDEDETWMHSAHLFNYLGIDSEDGSAFMEDARAQVDSFGVTRHQETPVTDVAEIDGGFRVETEEAAYQARYVVFATGTDRELPAALGCERSADESVAVDIDMRTSIEGAYAVGGTARDGKWQAIISAGDGAAAALDILSEEAGEPVHDFDTPADAE